MEKVTFRSENTVCAADLFVPETYLAGSRLPAIVFGRGFSMVKEASLVEAGYLQRAGYVVMSIDYRTFGESEGEPRGELFPLRQVEDYRNAITYLQLRPEVDPDRIGLWGTSFSGGVAIYTAAVDRRAQAVVAQVPIVNGLRWMQALRSRDQWDELLDRLDADRLRRFRTGQGERIPVTGLAKKGEFCAMPSDEVEVNFLADAKEQLKTWRDNITLESIEKVIEFDPEAMINRIGPRPLCIITTGGHDVLHPVDQILNAFEKAREPKQMVLLAMDQFDPYKEPGRAVAFGHTIDWFDRFIGPRSPRQNGS